MCLEVGREGCCRLLPLRSTDLVGAASAVPDTFANVGFDQELPRKTERSASFLQSSRSLSLLWFSLLPRGDAVKGISAPSFAAEGKWVN